MLTELYLEGFKRHGKPTRIPLAPITLLLGSNAAGKSSVFQALLALKQSFARGPASFFDLDTTGPYARLGRFGNVQTGHNADVEVKIGLTWYDRAVKFGWSDVELGAPVRHRAGEALIDANELSGMELRNGEAALSMLTDTLGQRHVLPTTGPSWRSGAGVRRESGDHLMEFLLHAPHSSTIADVAFSPLQRGRTIERFWTPVSPEVSDSCRRPLEDENDFKDLQSQVGDILDRTLFAAEELVRELRHIGPTRRPGQRAYDTSRPREDAVGEQGEHLAASLLIGDRAARVNEALNRIGVPYQLSIQDLPTLGPTIDIRLVETSASGRHQVGISDVGFGVSQLLPILAEWVALEERRNGDANRSEPALFCIEQPELHLHPRWQVELLYLLATPAVRRRRAIERNKSLPETQRETQPRPFAQVLLETHSEITVRAAQKLVELGRLDPADVSILSFETVNGEASVERITLDRLGRFKRAWPRGFFVERDDLMFGEGPSDDAF